MSHCVKVMLLLVVMVSMSAAQLLSSRNSCLCQGLRAGISQRSRVREIQAYAPSVYCRNVEIVVTEKSGLRYCLDPNAKQVQMMVQSMKRK